MNKRAQFYRAGRAALKAGLAGLLLLGACAGQAQNLVPISASRDAEVALAGIFKAIEADQLADAMIRVDALIASKPNYRLAYLIKGDLLLARALMRPDQKHAVVIDTRKSRLYVYANDNGRPRFVADYYMSHGRNGIDKSREGDQKTPVGVYYVTSHLPKEKLADIYGAGAFPINYPNDWDRRNGRSGHGIWLHGVPADTFARAPLASDGCVALSNADFEMMGKNIEVGSTPVIISEDVEWLSQDDWNSQRQSLLGAIEKWRRDWESRDTDAYLSHYAKNFSGDGMSLAQWAERKRKLNAAKEWIKVKLGNMDMFRYPGREEMVVVSFEQDYQSSNLSNAMKKRLYWIKEGGSWKILDEGAG
jgi:murein L,D-transpeptidase YafK